METSAKTNFNIDKAFNELTILIMEQKQEESVPNQKIVLDNKSTGSSGCCYNY